MFETLLEENKKAPDETLIGLSKTRLYFTNFARSAVSVLFIYGAFTTTAIFGIIAYALLAVGAIYLIISNHRRFSNEPALQLKINNKGIYVKKRYISWSQIDSFSFEDINKRSSSIYPDQYLVLHSKSGSQNKIDISNFAISTGKLNYLLRIYKDRSLKAE